MTNRILHKTPSGEYPRPPCGVGMASCVLQAKLKQTCISLRLEVEASEDQDENYKETHQNQAKPLGKHCKIRKQRVN